MVAAVELRGYNYNDKHYEQASIMSKQLRWFEESVFKFKYFLSFCILHM